jgi:hypothetical protein
MARYFTERHGQPEPRVKEFLDGDIRGALLRLVQTRIADNSFGESFPDQCPDGRGNSGVNETALRDVMGGYRIIWPADVQRLDDDQITDGQLFDLLEFSYEHISEPVPGENHSWFGHCHYTYQRDTGRERFANEINRLFERNGIAFQFQHGEVERMVPTVLQEVLTQAQFNTGDTFLDQLLSTAREKFLNRDLIVRREALEKVWDAWERLKSLSDPQNKRNSIKLLLDRGASEPSLRARIETEARELTDIGNDFFIRHTEVTKIPITESVHVDYLFHRMFSLIRMLLKANGVSI